MRTFTSPTRLLPIATALALMTLSPTTLASGNSAQPKKPADPIVVHVDDRGFHWGDAAIGAAAGFGVALVLAGSLALIGRSDRRVDRPASDRHQRLREPLRAQERLSIHDRRESP